MIHVAALNTTPRACRLDSTMPVTRLTLSFAFTNSSLYGRASSPLRGRILLPIISYTPPQTCYRSTTISHHMRTIARTFSSPASPSSTNPAPLPIPPLSPHDLLPSTPPAILLEHLTGAPDRMVGDESDPAVGGVAWQSQDGSECMPNENQKNDPAKVVKTCNIAHDHGCVDPDLAEALSTKNGDSFLEHNPVALSFLQNLEKSGFTLTAVGRRILLNSCADIAPGILTAAKHAKIGTNIEQLLDNIREGEFDVNGAATLLYTGVTGDIDDRTWDMVHELKASIEYFEQLFGGVKMFCIDFYNSPLYELLYILISTDSVTRRKLIIISEPAVKY